MTEPAPFAAYATYADLITAVTEQLSSGTEIDPAEARRHLASAASEHLRDMVSLSSRRQAGTFFTPPTLAKRALQPYANDIINGLSVLDPACGAGDLLLAAASIAHGVVGDRSQLYSQFHGAEIVPELSSAAKARLALSAALEGAAATSVIRTIDGIKATRQLKTRKLIAVNPPYGQVDYGVTAWGSGRTTAAAHFIAELISAAEPGDKMCAILPEVLRSGSRYNRWRSLIAKEAIIVGIEPVGRFDEHANVDVFILHLQKAGPAKFEPSSWPTCDSENDTLGDQFQISVGSVVPHRDSMQGNDHPYLHSKNTHINSTVLNSAERISHSRAAVDPPFVLIRRTSAPSEGKNRFSVTCVTGSEPYVVENHLLILRPNDQDIDSCMNLYRYLQLTVTTEWINERSRMRHLTVTTIRQMPTGLDGFRSLKN